MSAQGEWNMFWLPKTIRENPRAERIHRSILQLVGVLYLQEDVDDRGRRAQLLDTLMERYSQLPDGGQSLLDPFAISVLEALLSRRCVPSAYASAYSKAIQGLKDKEPKGTLVKDVRALLHDMPGKTDPPDYWCAFYACAIQDPAIAKSMLTRAESLDISHMLHLQGLPVESLPTTDWPATAPGSLERRLVEEHKILRTAFAISCLQKLFTRLPA